jgi:uncharacterized protein (DUF2236 family)
MGRVQALSGVIRGFPHPSPGRPGDPGLFAPRSLAWRINRETILLLGGGRALLMQVAHPLVAAGVADHSDFTRSSFDRLWRTVFVGPLPGAIRERYYLEMRRMGTAFGVPEPLHPPTYAAFRAYVDRTIDELVVTDESRAVARRVLSPAMPPVVVPAGLLSGLASVGLLPQRIRRELGLRWNRGTQAAFVSMAATLRTTVPLLPDRVRVWPHARAAAARLGSAAA